MKELLDKLLQRHKYLEPTAEEELRRQVNVLYGAFTGLIGSEKMVLRASKYSALSYIHSEDPRQRLVQMRIHRPPPPGSWSDETVHSGH